MINIFTDGSCYYKTRQGGVGIYIIDSKGKEYFKAKGYSDTTISRMEMLGIIKGLKCIKNKEAIINLYSDSQYAINCGLEYIKKWRRDGSFKYRTNVDLLIEMETEINKCKNLNLIHTRGHQKDLSNDIVFGNAIADILADYKNFI